MAKVITEVAAPWRYEVCPYGDTVDLLTVGGIRVKGQWQGRLGEHYMAWMPLPKRDKHKELELKLGTDFLPDNFKAPPQNAPAVRKSWVVPVLVSLGLIYLVFPLAFLLLAPLIGSLLASLTSVTLVAVCFILLIANQCSNWENL